MTLIESLLSAEVQAALSQPYDGRGAKRSAARICAILYACQCQREPQATLLIELEIARLRVQADSKGTAGQKFAFHKIAALEECLAIMRGSHAPASA